MKPIEEQFVDWEAYAFGYGYGTGEEPILQALKIFFEHVDTNRSYTYDYRMLEHVLGASTAWLLITALIKTDIIEYGTSPRVGFFTKAGRALYEFVCSHTVTELCDIVLASTEHDYCTKSYCNCIDSKYSEAGCKNNIFFEGGI